MCLRVFRAAPDQGLVSEDQQSTRRWPHSCIFQQTFPWPPVDSFNSAVKINLTQDPERVFEDSNWRLYGTSWFVRRSWKFVLCLFETAWPFILLSPKINLCTREDSQMLKLMLPLRESSYHLHHIQIQAAALSNEQQSGTMSRVSGPLSRGERERKSREREMRGEGGEGEEGGKRRGGEKGRGRGRERETKKEGER